MEQEMQQLLSALYLRLKGFQSLLQQGLCGREICEKMGRGVYNQEKTDAEIEWIPGV